jgi:hypothetical protein
MAYTDIDKSDDYFNPVTWTGTGDPTTSVTGVNFQPDFVWIKNRSVADDHMLFDAVRGVTKRLFSNSTAAEGTDVQTLTSFDSDGFTTGNNRATGGDAGNGMVSWNWLGSNGTVANTDGSISSTVSANTTSGFSIVSYTGTGANATVGHGLGVTPKMMIVKNRTTVTNWHVYHKAIGATKYLHLNLTNAEGTASSVWNDTAPTSSVFSIGTGDGTNKSGDNIIAYCFAEKTGYSKFGSYTGNGNADGTFIYTGFKPAFVLTKSSSNSGASYNWQMWDNKRNTYNAVDTQLRPNTSESDNPDVSYSMDFVSNGFKMRGTNTNQNGSGSTYIYMAFAENPFVTSTGIPTTAR